MLRVRPKMDPPRPKMDPPVRLGALEGGRRRTNFSGSLGAALERADRQTNSSASLAGGGGRRLTQFKRMTVTKRSGEQN